MKRCVTCSTQYKTDQDGMSVVAMKPILIFLLRYLLQENNRPTLHLTMPLVAESNKVANATSHKSEMVVLSDVSSKTITHLQFIHKVIGLTNVIQKHCNSGFFLIYSIIIFQAKIVAIVCYILYIIFFAKNMTLYIMVVLVWYMMVVWYVVIVIHIVIVSIVQYNIVFDVQYYYSIVCILSILPLILLVDKKRWRMLFLWI